jgi:hypothetical protein
MKRFRILTFLVFAIYFATILGASFHADHNNSDHMNCKLCQLSSDSADRTSVAETVPELGDFGTLSGLASIFVRTEIATLKSGRAPPTISL